MTQDFHAKKKKKHLSPKKKKLYNGGISRVSVASNQSSSRFNALPLGYSAPLWHS